MLRFVFTIFIFIRASWSAATSIIHPAPKKLPPLMTGYLKVHIATGSFFYPVNNPVCFSVFVLHPATLQPFQFSHILDLTVLDSRNQKIFNKQFQTDNGLISDILPATLFGTGGTYTLVATAKMNGNTFVSRRSIVVQSVIKSNILFHIRPDREQYAAGDSITLAFNVREENGDPVKYASIEVSERYLASESGKYQLKTDETGHAVLKSVIDQKYDHNDLMFSATLSFRGEKYSRNERISLNTGQMDVKAFFENGTYHTEIDNSVILICSNEIGELAKFKFWIIDRTIPDSQLITTDAYGLYRYKLAAGKHMENLMIRPLVNPGKSLQLSPELPGNMVLGIVKKTNDQIRYSVYSSIEKKVFALSQIRGTKVGRQTVQISKGWNYFDIHISNSVQGVLQTLLMDSSYQVLAEKLAYIHPQEQLQFSIDKYKLQADKSATIEVSVKDHQGKPVQGTFTISVSDEENFLTVKDKQAKISENLFFENELLYPVNDITTLFETGNDSLLDLFLAGCSLKNAYWKQILIDDNEQKTLFCYQFTIKPNTYNPSYKLKDIQSVMFSSKKGKYRATVHDNGTILVPLDQIEFPARCYVKFGKFKDVDFIYKRHASIVALRDSVFLTSQSKATEVIVLKGPQKHQISVAEVKKPEEQNNPAQGPSGRGARADANAEFVDGARVNNFDGAAAVGMKVNVKLSSTSTSTVYYGYSATKTGIRGFSALASLASGVTMTRIGVSGRGSRPDGTAYFIDGVRIINMAYVRPLPFSASSPYNLPTAYIPPVNSMGGGVSGGRYYSSSYPQYYYASNTHNSGNFMFVNSPEFSQTYSTNYAYRASDDLSDQGCYYFISHFTTDHKGTGLLHVQTPDRSKAWHINIQGTGNRECGTFDSSIQISRAVFMTMKAPSFMMKNDYADIQITIVNHSDEPVKPVLLDMSNAEKTDIPEIAPQSSYLYTERLLFKDPTRELHYALYMPNEKKGQEVYKYIKVIDNAYKKLESYTITKSATFDFNIRDTGKYYTMTLKCPQPLDKSLGAYLESMITEPHGCFEQVSSTNYPNILAYTFLKNSGNAKTEDYKKFLESGYKKLAQYETSGGGFSWFGNADGKGNEALTAMGVLQFSKLSACGIKIDDKMMERTKKWLLEKRDAIGLFVQSKGKYDGFANITPEVAHAYITYALAETGERNLESSIEVIRKTLAQKPNLYNTALLTAILIAQKHPDYSTYLQDLKKAFQTLPTTPLNVWSVVNSSSIGAINETFAIAAVAIFKHKLVSEYGFASSVCEYFNSQNRYQWGNMQSKALVLEALSYHTGAPEGQKNFKLRYIINGIAADTLINPSGKQSLDLSHLLKNGSNAVAFELEGSAKMLVELEQSSFLPFTEGKSSVINVSAQFDKKTYKKAELAQYRIKIDNTENAVLPQSVAIICMPTGMNIEPEELLFLKKQKICDFYEIKDNQLYLYWEEMKPNEHIDIKLPFTCAVSGRFTIGSCSVYKYYQPENKTYFLPGAVAIE